MSLTTCLLVQLFNELYFNRNNRNENDKFCRLYHNKCKEQMSTVKMLLTAKQLSFYNNNMTSGVGFFFTLKDGNSVFYIYKVISVNFSRVMVITHMIINHFV